MSPPSASSSSVVSPAKGELRRCRCSDPSFDPNPRSKSNEGLDYCLKCSAHFDPESDWLSNDGTMAEFFDRLEESMVSLGILNALGPPEWLADFRLAAEQREVAGRKTFRHKHLRRDNAREAMEEASDGANYCLYALLAARRTGDTEEWEIALTAAKHFAEAFRYCQVLRNHRHTSISPS